MIGYGMGFHAGGVIWILVLGALVVVPFWRLLPDYGIPAWVSVLAVFPLVALALLWIMAFRERTTGGER